MRPVSCKKGTDRGNCGARERKVLGRQKEGPWKVDRQEKREKVSESETDRQTDRQTNKQNKELHLRERE